MAKGSSVILSLSISAILILAALMVKSQASEAAPAPLPELRGACYFSGDKGCKPDVAEKECHSPQNNYNYWDAGKKCTEEAHVLVEDEWIEGCVDARKLPEAEKKCREKLEAEVKAQESGKSPFPICSEKFQPLTKVAISASYRDAKYKLCVANCSMVYQCVKALPPAITPVPPPPLPPAPSPTPTPSSTPTPNPTSTPKTTPTYAPVPSQTPTPMTPTPPPPSETPTPTPSNTVPPAPSPGF